MAETKEKVRGRKLLDKLGENDIETVLNLLEGPEAIDLDVVTRGDAAIHLAARRGRLDVVKLLVKRGDNVNKKNENGNTPMHYAAKDGYMELVEYLISKKSDVNVKNKEGDTPLHGAVKLQSMDVIEQYARMGMNVNSQNDTGQTPLHIAIRYSRQESVEALLLAGADSSKLSVDGKGIEALTNDADLIEEIKMFEILKSAMETGIIKAEGKTIIPKQTQFPLPLARVGVSIEHCQTVAVLPFLLYSRREKTENCSLKFSIDSEEEVMSDVFQFRISDIVTGVSMTVHVPIYSECPSKQELILRYIDGPPIELDKEIKVDQTIKVAIALELKPEYTQMFAIFMRPKTEEFTVDKNGMTITSTIDEDFVLEIPPKSFDKETKLSMKVFETNEPKDQKEPPAANRGDSQEEVEESQQQLLFSDVYQVNVKGKQPKKDVNVHLPLHAEQNLEKESAEKDDDMIIITADEKKLIDENSLMVVPFKPKKDRNRVVFKASHFSIHVVTTKEKFEKKKSDIFQKVCMSVFRQREAVFFAVAKPVAADSFQVLVECAISDKAEKRKKYWENKGYVSCHVPFSNTAKLTAYQEFIVQFGGNIHSNDTKGHRHLAFLPRRASFQPYTVGIRNSSASPTGEVRLTKVTPEMERKSAGHDSVPLIRIKLKMPTWHGDETRPSWKSPGKYHYSLE